MDPFASYDIIGPPRRRPPYELHVIKPKAGGDQQPRLLITFTPDPVFATDEQVAVLIQSFWRSIQFQKQFAQKNPGAWAPIYDGDCDKRSAYYITDFYPAFADSLAGAVDGTTLRIVVEAVTRGLEPLHARGRQHGKLNDSNILFDSADRRRALQIALTEPVLVERALSQDQPLADLQGLGRLIYCLVTGEITAPSAFPLLLGPAWTRPALGGGGEAWLKLCNLLLNPAADPAKLTMASVRQHMPRAARRSRPRWPWAALAVVVCVAVVVGWILRPRPQPQPQYMTPQEWRELGKINYFILEQFPTDLTKLPSELQSNPALVAELDKVKTKDFYNPKIITQWDKNFPNPKDIPNINDISKDNDKILITKGRDKIIGLKGKEAYESAIKIRDSIKAFNDTLSRDADKYQQWKHSTGPLRDAIAKIKDILNGLSRDPLVESLKNAQDARDDLERIAKPRESLESKITKLEETNDPALKPFRSYANEQASGDENSFKGLIRQAENLRQRWGEMKEPDFDSAAYQKDNAEIQSHLLSTARFEGYQQWMDRTEAYRWINPPREFDDLLKSLKETENQRLKLAGLSIEAAQTYENRIKTIQNAMAALPPFTAKKGNDVKSILVEEREKLKKIAGDIQGEINSRENNLAKWFGEVRKRGEVTSSETLNAAWRKRVEKRLHNWSDNDADRFAQDQQAKSIKPDLEYWQNKLQLLDTTEFPSSTTTKLPKDRPWPTEALKLVTEQREAALRKALETFDTDDIRKADNQALGRIKEGYDTYCSSARHVLDRLNNVQDLLDQCEEIGIEKLVKDNLKERAFEDLRKTVECKTIIDQADSLISVAALSRAELLKAVDKEPLAVRWAAWSRLSEPSIAWPGNNMPELKQEYDSGKWLKANIEQAEKLEAKNKKRMLDAVGARMARIPALWQKQFLAKADVKDLKELQFDDLKSEMSNVDLELQWKLMKDFKSAEAATVLTDPKARWNLLIIALNSKIKADKDKGDENVQRHITAFKENVKNDDVVASLQQYKLFLERWSTATKAPASPLEKEAPKVTSTRKTLNPQHAGPAEKLHWQTPSQEPDEFVTYSSRDPKVKLTFHRFQTSDGKPFYLATTTVSLAVFKQILADAGADALKDVKKNDWLRNPSADVGKVDPSGPYVWIWKDDAQTAIQKAPTWWDPHPAWTDNDGYAPQMEVSPPTERHPMQRISPQAALYLAYLSGCRLPTSQEWKQACVTTQADKAPPSTWNLRDATWKKQWEYASKPSPGVLPYPNHNTFQPSDGRVPETGKPITSDDDHALWFLEVDKTVNDQKPLGGMYHLIGNVAQYVFDGPTPDSTVDSPRDRVDKLLKNNPKMMKVIGGSALSSPAIWESGHFDEPQPVNLNKSVSGSGFSDVGVRLALDLEPGDEKVVSQPPPAKPQTQETLVKRLTDILNQPGTWVLSSPK